MIDSHPCTIGPSRLTARRRAPLARLLATSFLAASLVSCGRSEGASKSASKATGPLPVTVTPAARHTFSRTLEVEGNLEPAERILIAPSIPGVIRKITKRAGDRIHKGEVLLTVDPKEIYVGTIQLRVGLSSARARAQAAGQILTRLKEPLKRLRRLYHAGAISKTELDKIEIPFVRAKAERDASARVIRKMKGELGIAYSKLSETKIRAPFDGFVVRRLVDPGEVARAFPPTVALVITRHHPLYVQAEVGEQDIGRVRKGQRVPVTLDALPGAPPRSGVVEEIIPYVNPMTRTVTVRIRVSNADGVLMPGMSAHVSLRLRPRILLAIPVQALATEPMEERASVFVVAHGVARERRIRFGRAQDGWLAVLSGLGARDSVVVTGHEPLVDGSKVAATPAALPRSVSRPAARFTPTSKPAAGTRPVSRPAARFTPTSTPAAGTRPAARPTAGPRPTARASRPAPPRGGAHR